MASVNRVTILGRLGKDPELTSVGSESQVCKFSVATSEKYKGKETTTWHNIEAWGKTAEICSTYLSKGREVYIEGKIKNDTWEDKETGKKRTATKISALSVQLLGGRGDDQEKTSESGGLDDLPF